MTGGRSFGNPLPLADQKAQELKGLLGRAAAKDRGIRMPFVRGCVFLAEPQMVCELEPEQRHHLYAPDGSKPAAVLRELGADLLLAAQHHRGAVGDRTAPLRRWPTWQDHRASRDELPGTPYRRIRIYLYERQADPDARESVRHAAQREFLAGPDIRLRHVLDHAEWEHTWDLQRQEDVIAARLGYDDVTHKEVRRAIEQEIGQVPVPPNYAPGELLRGSCWSRRGKLKERFVSYPAASRDGDGSRLLGWASWDHHREQAQALAVLVTQRRNQLTELDLSRAQLADWRPAGRVDVAPIPRRSAPRRRTDDAAPRTRRPRSAPDPELLDAVVAAAAAGPLSGKQIREATGLDAAPAPSPSSLSPTVGS